MKYTEKQNEAIETIKYRYDHHLKYTVIIGAGGTGKAQPIDTIIPTPQGDKQLKELKIGDYVYDRFGKPTKVLGIYPQGIIDNYKVTFSDGRVSYCNNEHIWSCFTSRGNLKEVTVSDMIKAGLKRKQGEAKYQIPVNELIEYNEKKYDIHPYIIGAFLGDGCCLERQLTISSEDEEIPLKIAKLTNTEAIKNSDFNYSWSFKIKDIDDKAYYQSYNKQITKLQTNIFFKKYKNEICVKSTLKKIPLEYCFGSSEQRLELLRGLFDTDGSITFAEGRYKIRFTNTSLELIKQVQYILHTLGYNSTILIDKRENKYANNICYNLSVLCDNKEKYKFFSLKRKKEIALQAINKKQHRNYNRLSIINIEKMSEKKEMLCIYVDNKEHLYLTNDFLVTHNTSLVKGAIEKIGIPDNEVVYCAYTGKAAKVLQQKGNKNVSTLHKLLFKSFPKADGTYMFVPRDCLEKNYTFVVVDECSMIPQAMVDLLSKFNVYVVYLGDNAQLPPVGGNKNTLFENPHVELTEIMRQEADSEIIKFGKDVREEKPLPLTYNGKDVQIYQQNELTTGMLKWADIILCATNENRRRINLKMRELLGFSGAPKVGDKIICVKNDWNILDNDNNALVNGTIGYITRIEKRYIPVYKYFNQPENKLYFYDIDLLTEEGTKFYHLSIDCGLIDSGIKKVSDSLNEKLKSNKQIRNRLPSKRIEYFEYGYCISTWKSQGSEWNKVLTIEERFPFDKEEHRRWLYTSLSRSASKAIIIRK